MRLVNRCLPLHWALGLYLLLLLCWEPTTTQARFISKRETPSMEMGVAGVAIDPDIVKLQSESANVSDTTTIQPHRVKLALQEVETTTTSPTTAGISSTLAVSNSSSLETTQSMLKSFQSPDGMTTTPSNVELLGQPMLNEDQNHTVKTEQQLKPPDELTTKSTPTKAPSSSSEATTRSTEGLRSTVRDEDRARSMQFASSTEYLSFGSPVTPMKLRPIPMTTTITTTHMPHLLAALLHAEVTVTPSASDENVIEQEGEEEKEKQQQQQQQLQSQSEKRAKFIADNSTNAQQLSLPNGAEVWSLAAMTTTTTTITMPTTTEQPASGKGAELTNDIEERNQTMQQYKEKSLLDWQQIMMMQTGQDNHTEPMMMSTTLDSTEAATQPTTLKLDISLNQGEMFTSASSAVTEQTVNKTEATTDTQHKDRLPLPAAEPSTTEVSTATLTAAIQMKPALSEADDELSTTTTASPDPIVGSAVTALAKPETTTTESVITESITAAAATTMSVDLATAERETPTESTSTSTTSTSTSTSTLASSTSISTSTSTTTTAVPSGLNATPNPNTNEMAMNATAHQNNENDDKENNVVVESGSKSTSKTTDSDDVINVSVSVSTTETTLGATERQTITVSMRTAVEASTTPITPTVPTVTPTRKPTPTSTSTPSPTTLQTLHAKVDEQSAATTTTLVAPTTPTPTEIVQISNEVNLETITVKNVTNDNSVSNINNNNNLLITTSSTAKPINSAANSEPLQIDTNSTSTSHLNDEKANSNLNEHETSLETNNIGETAGKVVITTTTTTTTDEPVPSTRTVTDATALAANRLDESKAIPPIRTTATASEATAAKGESELYEDEDEEDEQLPLQQNNNHDHGTEESLLSTTIMANTTTTTTEAAVTTAAATTMTTAAATAATGAAKTTTTTEEPIISLLDDSTSSTSSSTTSTTTTTRTTITFTPRPTTTTTTTAEPIYSSTHTTSNKNNMLPVESTTHASDLPTTMLMPSRPTELDLMHQPPPSSTSGTDVNVVIAITVSVIGVVALILLVAFLYLMRKRQKQMSYAQRCRPVSLDAYSLDNVSVLGSVRRKGRDLRASKRTYGNAAFDDPSLRHNLLSATELSKFLERKSSIFEEFRDVPQIIARADEVPAGCEDKNRYANVIPLPETRVVLQRQGDDDKTEYINANYVRGPRDAPNYYIACQAPLESTTGDFWRMIWEQQSRVIVQATDLNENGIERCAEYLPPSVTLDNHSSHGDYQVTLKHREVKDKYAISTLMLKRVDGDECRELTHYWYKWPEAGVPLEEAPIIAMLLEARSSLKSYALEQANELKEKSSTLTLKSMDTAINESADTQPKKPQADEGGSSSSNEINGNVANKQYRNQQGPLTIHCSPGTGRTGTVIACDMAIRSLETPKRSVDIPQLVYYVRRGRASSVQTKEQYEFIYKVANMYATKITNVSNDN